MIGRGPSVARIEGITQRYGAAIALDGVDIEIPSSCMAGFIGPDGVGTSTLLRIIAGARQIQTGKAFVLGGDMADTAHRLAVCSRIAYCPKAWASTFTPISRCVRT
jgi:ribosome-dependent ATPase